MRSLSEHEVSEIIDSHRHPKGLWCMSVVYSFYTFAFGSVNALLVLFMIRKVGFASADAYAIYAAFNSLIWTFPLAGGWLAGKFGYKQLTIIGLLICILGLLLYSIANPLAMYVGLGAFVVGYGMSTPACFAMIGLLYDKQDKRRESGYTMFYLLFNFGFLAAGITSGYFARYFGYLHTFMIDAFAMICSLLVFIIFSKWIQPHPGRTMAPQVKWSNIKVIALPIAVGIIATPFMSLLLKFPHLDNLVLWVLFLGAVAGVFWLAHKQTEKLAKYRLYALLALLTISLAFWSLYMLEPSLLTVFIASNVNRNIFSLNIPAASYYSLDAFFVIVVGYMLSRLWWILGHKGKDPSLPAKFSIALVIMGGGYLLLIVGMLFTNFQHLTSSLWIVLCYLFLATAELLIAPISMSMVGRLSPKGKEGALMGVQQLFTGFSAVLSGYLANLAVVPDKGLPVQTNPIYNQAFLEIGSVTIALGLVAACFIPVIKKLMKPADAASVVH